MVIIRNLVFGALILGCGFSFAQSDQKNTSTPNPAAGKGSRSVLRGVANKDFNKPLYFDQVNQGVVLPAMELEYEVLPDEKKALKIGPVLLAEESFYVRMFRKQDLPEEQKNAFLDLKSEANFLIFAWPSSFFEPQVLEAISTNGQVLWSQVISASDLKSWKEKMEANKLTGKGTFRGVQWALLDWQPPLALQRSSSGFRFCFIQQFEEQKTRLCTGSFGFQKVGNDLKLRRRVESKGSRVLVDNEPAPAKGNVPLKKDASRVFFAELPFGGLVEIFSRSPAFELMDIIESPRESRLRLVGSGVQPLQRSVLLNKEQYNALTVLLGFEETIRDMRNIWATYIDEKDAKLYFPGPGGGVFKQRLELSEIPSFRSRVYLSRNTSTSTYSSEISLKGRKSPVVKIESQENSVEIEKPEDKEFIWNFKSEEKGQINRSYLTVQAGEKSYRSYYEIYRGYSSELSARLGVVQSSSFIFMGELSLNHWFESLFGWDNYWVSRHRWGLSLRQFQSLTDIQLNNGTESVQLSATTADLRFRLSPGLWGRDEALGLLASYQNVIFGKSEAPMAGGGVFWARSMPRSIDGIFNLFPFMNYPKWVDVEFIYYVTPLKSDIELNSSMSLNFHGKVLWTSTVFGEAGFGIKRYAYKDLGLVQLAELNSFYGTMGIGISF